VNGVEQYVGARKPREEMLVGRHGDEPDAIEECCRETAESVLERLALVRLELDEDDAGAGIELDDPREYAVHRRLHLLQRLRTEVDAITRSASSSRIASIGRQWRW
jgi:hypothetical protein